MNEEIKLMKVSYAELQRKLIECNSDRIRLQQENQQLKSTLNEINNAYCKVITKCKEMKKSRYYMNDIAIGKYADEIMEICKYYVEEPKWQDSLDKVKE